MSRSRQAWQLARHLTEVTGGTELELNWENGPRWNLHWTDGPLVEEMRAHLDTALAGYHYTEMRDRKIACSRSYSERAWAARAIASRREGTLAPAVAAEVARRRAMGLELPRLSVNVPSESHEYYALLSYVEQLWQVTSYPERPSVTEDEPLIKELLAAGTKTSEYHSWPSEYEMTKVLLSAMRAPVGDQPPQLSVVPSGPEQAR
ncbi:hypothetical protein [Streptacidiphilus carbonis]|uniref:hypothetical protein n=1 Tax=Streptacidiphilus carbonis TaxID=105422 RepID=UPI0005A9E351|nr:hypothetical protein [Streptacidiphilus carbonis]